MFADRKDAGMILMGKLVHLKGLRGLLVLALPRGGVATGFEVAKGLDAPLDVLIVRKIGFPGQPELAAAALSETGKLHINPFISGMEEVRPFIEAEVKRQKKEIERRVGLYRKGRPRAEVEGKVIVLVDDGVATGATMKAAIITLRQEGIRRLVVAVPVAPPETAGELQGMADEFVCLLIPPDFMSVGGYYHDFAQVSDEEVVAMLDASKKETPMEGKR